MNKESIYKIVFESDTKAGNLFDVILLWLISISVVVAILDSVESISIYLSHWFLAIEIILTIAFSIEYILRIFISKKPIHYIFSFWGIIDLLAILPTYLALFVSGYHYFLVVRVFRLLRIFRILKLVRFNREAILLSKSLKSSSYKIGVFFSAVITIVILLGTVMYVVEDAENGFTSIPESIYWAVITITTVGYGDIVPHTVLGKFISSIAMIIGYAIIAVPTGIITAEMARSSFKIDEEVTCIECNSKIHKKSNFCPKCGYQQ
ncbi:MAG TPA: ion transporter [Chitinophagales bacterium]|nr:ion transporter [Chitinophagales bacterium]